MYFAGLDLNAFAVNLRDYQITVEPRASFTGKLTKAYLHDYLDNPLFKPGSLRASTYFSFSKVFEINC